MTTVQPPTSDPEAVAAVQEGLLAWYAREQRRLPWRDTTDPYAVLVSEVMLQQTQVTRVVPAYRRFLQLFPDPRALAAAPTGQVLQAWRGLGYNRRALALQLAARTVVDRHGGVFPVTLHELKALPGVGEYTARAVLAFAFGRDEAPVDTNVRRVLLRALAGRDLAPAALQRLADIAVPAGQGRYWSAAVMDLGSAHCTARSPACSTCPLAAACAWRRHGGDDPAAPRARRPTPFVGSARFHRGRLLDALRSGPVPTHQLASAAHAADAVAARRTAESLVADGLARWRGTTLTLPD
ncbi:MAG TPA: A/G-specific adenine glycosylase [Egibacteraceae bacterium]|nr:A/G-specific adenine glycosylase [Egibacteraceae bacterium]